LYRLGAVAVISNNTEAFRQAAEKNRLAACAPQKVCDAVIMEKREQRAKALADQQAHPTLFADLK
jgi:hypothetical protein